MSSPKSVVLARACASALVRQWPTFGSTLEKGICVREDIKRSYATQAATRSTEMNPKILRSPFGDLDLPKVSIAEIIWQDLDKWPDHTAISCGLTGRSYTYAELRNLSRRFARALQKLGLRPGDVLAVMLPNIPEYAIVVLGAIEAGVIVTGINPLYTPEEISHQISDSKAKAAVILPMFASTFQNAIKIVQSRMSSPYSLTTVTLDDKTGIEVKGAIDFLELLLTSDNEPVGYTPKLDDIAMLPYSSGTTGLSKGVQLTHKNIVSNIVQMGSSDSAHSHYLEDTTSTYQDVIPAVLPFFHIYGISTIMLLSLHKGCKLVCIPKFDPTAYLSVLKEQRSTVLYVAPPLLLFLANHPQVKDEDIASARVVFNAAGGVPEADVEKLLSRTRNKILFRQGYGLTETSPGITASEPSQNIRTIGCPIANTVVKIIDEDGTILGPYQQGELCARGPQVMKGYHNNEEATAGTIDQDGFLHTGDLAYFDENECIYIVDRKKELIKVKGFQVAPMELEGILKKHPGVLDVGVIGIPDSRTGEKPLAYVIPNGLVKPTEQELIDFVATRVAPFKQISGVVFVDSLPKNLTGKLLRRVLKETYYKSNNC